MKKIFLVLITLLMTNFAIAADIDWNIIDSAFKTKAEYQETPFGTYAILKDIVQNGNISRDANYFSAVGAFDENNEFQIGRYEIVSENWQNKNGTLYIDQWLIAYNLNYELTYKSHRLLIEDLNGSVLDTKEITETNDSYSKKADSLLDFWATKIK